MTRAKGRPTASADILAELMQNRRLERLAKQHGRWDERRRAEHAKKAKRTRHLKQMAKLNAKRVPKHPLLGDVNRLSLAERVTLHMLPGEWLTLNDVAERMQVKPATIKPILYQRLLRLGIAVKAAMAGAPEEEHTIWQVTGVSMPRRVFALTLFGCAVRAALLEQVAAPETTPPVGPEIPEKFLDSFQIEVSPFLGGVGPCAVPGGRFGAAAAKRAAWARVAEAHGAADPFLPAEW